MRRRYSRNPDTRDYIWHITRYRLAWISAGLVVVLLLFLLAAVFLPRHPFSSRQWFFEVKEGQNLRGIAVRLKQDGLIGNSFLFRVAGRLRGADTRVKAGEYRLRRDSSSWDILGHFLRGEVYLHEFTMPEGATLEQTAAALGERGLADGDAFLALAKNADFIRARGIKAPSLEGYLFPDTYRVPRGISNERLAGMMLERFSEKLPPGFEKRAALMGLSVEKLVALASIVEKEARVEEEMPLIAAVFHNRLKKKMRLESCATVRYIIGYEKESLRERDLAVASPYNTYLRRGLPPGAVCNPGAAALAAVSYPGKVDYLYFVSRGDGRHEFSVDYASHLAAKRKYQAGGK